MSLTKSKTDPLEYAESIINTVREPLIILDHDLRVVSVSRSFYKVFKVKPNETVGQLIYDLGNKQWDIPKLRDLLETILPKKATFDNYEVEHTFASIGKRIMLLNARQIRRMSGKERIILLAIEDITQRKATESGLERTRRELETTKISADEARDYSQAIIETMMEPLIVLDGEAHIVSANLSFYDAFKVSISDMLIKTFYELNGNQWDDPALRKLLEEILPKKTHFSDFEITLDFPETGLRTLILNGRQIKMKGQKRQMILLVFKDITERKRAEDILKRDSEALEKMIKARSQDLLDLQVRLERSKHLADIGTLAATVAHELRNSLAAISVATYNIRKKSNKTGIEQSLENIEKKILESDHIINNVLSYSKIKISRFESFRINKILKSCMTAVIKQFAAQGIAFRSDLDSTRDFFVEADPVQISEVFSNILNNAAEAVNVNKGIITIKTSIDDQTLTITIVDNGEGIEKNDTDKVINPFFTTKAKGTGLGLAVCSQILMLHDGALAIESCRGIGTEIRVTLPLSRLKKTADFMSP